MFSKILGVFKKKKSYVSIDEDNNKIRNNPNKCYYCGEEIGSGRFYFREGNHFHKRCIKKWILNEKEKTINAE